VKKTEDEHLYPWRMVKAEQGAQFQSSMPVFLWSQDLDMEIELIRPVICRPNRDGPVENPSL